jgi:hypothetical protein
MNIKLKLFFYLILIFLSTLSFAIDTKGDYVNDDIDIFSKNVIEASSDITLTLESHSNGSLVGDIVPIAVTVESVYELASLTAQIDDSVTTLVYSEEAIWILICQCYGPGFVGDLSLTGVPSGDYTMVIRATDSTAQTAQISITVTLDRAPTLNVTSPMNLSVARPTIPLNLSCGDDSGSCTIVVSINGQEVVRGTDTLEQDIDLTDRDGTVIDLIISAVDSRQQTTVDSRSIYVETSEFIASIFKAPAEVLDFTDNTVLYRKTDSNDLVISDLTKTDQTTVNLPVDYESGDIAYLSANGAIFVASNGPSVTYNNLFDFNDGNLYDLGYPNDDSSLVTDGNYAIWSNAKTLTLRDLSNKTNRIVSTNAGNWQNDVAESGLVVYWDHNYSVVLDSDGSQSTIASDVNLWNTYPMTDGDSVVYRKHVACCQDYSLYVYRANSNILLSDLGLNEPSQGSDYQINNGWIAFTDIGSSGQKQVWTLDPSNVKVKRNAFGTESTIVHLASNGELIFTFSGEYYLSKPDGTFTQIGLSQGQVGYDADGWHITLGREIFRIQSPALDSDGDGILDPNDNCINEPNFDQTDTDADQIGDTCDPDDDGDGVLDGSDAFPLDATESVDTDSDGTGNNADTDDDGDGVMDSSDAFPLDSAESIDTDLDGIGNNADNDDDGDGVLDSVDLYPLDASKTNEQLLDIDGNGKVDALTDGLVILRYVFGLRGDILIGGVVASDATRISAEEIEAYLASLMPSL